MTNKIFENFNILGSILLGCVGFLLGEWDLILKIMLLLIIFDVITGWLKAISCKTLSSQIGFSGLAKKIITLIIICVSNLLQKSLDNSIPLRETVLMFYIINEAISIIENAAHFIPIPNKLKNVLLQLKNTNEEKTKNSKTL